MTTLYWEAIWSILSTSTFDRVQTHAYYRATRTTPVKTAIENNCSHAKHTLNELNNSLRTLINVMPSPVELNFTANCWKNGSIDLHGLHHVAVNLQTTVLCFEWCSSHCSMDVMDVTAVEDEDDVVMLSCVVSLVFSQHDDGDDLESDFILSLLLELADADGRPAHCSTFSGSNPILASGPAIINRNTKARSGNIAE